MSTQAEALVREVISQTYGVNWSQGTFQSELDQLLSHSGKADMSSEGQSYALFIASTLSCLKLSEASDTTHDDEPDDDDDPFFIPVFTPR